MTLIADIVGVMDSGHSGSDGQCNDSGLLLGQHHTTSEHSQQLVSHALAGAMLILYSLYHRPNPGAIVKVIWVVVAIWGILRNRV